MAIVWVPSLLRALTGGLAEVAVAGATVREVIDALDAEYPGVKDRLVQCENGVTRLKPNIALVVDGVTSKQGLRHPLAESSEVHFVPALSGG
jgi:molybdopterin synthase sulfur carrier subunit